MELFSEIYGCYYTVVSQILRQARGNGLTRTEIDRIVEGNAFSESGFYLMPRLLGGEWDLLWEEDGRYRAKLEHADTSLPLTALQKSWLKSLLRDRRFRLFLDEKPLARLNDLLAAVEPLFDPDDFHIFDTAADGDDYADEGYIGRFRLILAAVKQKTPLLTQYESGKGGRMTMHFLPQKLLYSQKDDKFRVIGRQLTEKGSKPVLLNLARMKELMEPERTAPLSLTANDAADRKQIVRIAISDERNALERCMLQFASYDKQTVFDAGTMRYLCEISYDPLEETELLIRILSFGPVIEVLGPESFLEQVRERVRLQTERMSLFYPLSSD